MVYMQGKGRYNASRANQTSHFGIMGGLRPMTNGPRVLSNRGRSQQTIPLSPARGLAYMQKHDILSKNPAGSGGIGRMRLLIHRAM